MRPDMRACGSRYRRVSRATAGFTHDETTRHVPLRQTGMDVASNLLADKTPNKETLVTQLMYEMRAKQQTTLTPRLQQSVKLLQMSTLDFSREVAEAISNNPFLDEDENQAPEETPNEPHAPPVSEADSLNVDLAPATEDPVSGSDYDNVVTAEYDSSSESASTYSGDYPTSRNSDQPETDIGQWARSETSLQDSLRRDLSGYQLSMRDRVLVELIIEALDNDGYLREPVEELLEPGQLEPMPTPSEWDTALKLVQNLGAPGIGARDLQEC